MKQRILFNFCCNSLEKIQHQLSGFLLPTAGAKIPTGLVSQLQVEENLFMAVRNIQASLPPAAAASKAATAHCIIVSYCQMMAMARTAFSLLLPAVKSQILLEIRGKKYENASGRKSK